MYQLRVLQKAREDMRKSAEWYDEKQYGVGDRFLLSVIETFRLIQANPQHYEKDFQKIFGLLELNIFRSWLYLRSKNKKL